MAFNINSGASGNPLDALLNGRPIHGTSRVPVAGLFQQALSGGGIDPRLYDYGFNIDTQMESPVYTIGNQQVDPTGDIRINGRPYVQIENTNIGGPGQVIDPSQVIYDPQFGLLTQQSNLKPVSTGYGDAVFALGSLGMALPTAAIALGGSGIGSSAGVASTDAAESGGTLALNASGTGVTPYVGSAGETLGAAANYAPVSEGSTPIPGNGAPVIDHGVNANTGLFGNPSSMLQRAGTWAMNNPLRAAGLLQTVSGLVANGRNSGGTSSGSKSSGSHGSGLPLQNPAGSYQWTPNPYLLAQIGGRQ